ncbi:unnamed protein product [Musa acuminata subsp. malaccensis]|uniref:(wild Malaysian banana) hypothetical protein n=1 Tax=Musa acuminata subsp. malaccensis TaxID=214687 RepID=A0A804JFM1_MUSAM|nr:unnamed protein product [Musa acuminata subsp. malaccensis]
MKKCHFPLNLFQHEGCPLTRWLGDRGCSCLPIKIARCERERERERERESSALFSSSSQSPSHCRHVFMAAVSKAANLLRAGQQCFSLSLSWSAQSRR